MDTTTTNITLGVLLGHGQCLPDSISGSLLRYDVPLCQEKKVHNVADPEDPISVCKSHETSNRHQSFKLNGRLFTQFIVFLTGTQGKLQKLKTSNTIHKSALGEVILQ